MNSGQQTIVTIDNKYLLKKQFYKRHNIEVYLGENVQNDSKLYAIQIIRECPQISDNQFDQEVNFMKSLKHQNVSRFVEATKLKQDQYALVVEFPVNGFILDTILYSQDIDDKILRNFYLQILAGFQYLKDQNIDKLLLKSYDIIFDSYFNPNIVYFGFQFLNQSSYVYEDQYSAPEIVAGNSNSKKWQLEIFQLGILFFEIRHKTQPFTKAHSQNSQYKQFLKKNEDFWKNFSLESEQQDEKISFKNLINKMLNQDGEQRPNINIIKEDKFFTKYAIQQDQEAIKQEFQLILQQKAHDIKEKILLQPQITKNFKKKEQNLLYFAPLNFRNAQIDHQNNDQNELQNLQRYFENIESNRKLLDVKNDFHNQILIFTNCGFDSIFLKLISYFQFKEDNHSNSLIYTNTKVHDVYYEVTTQRCSINETVEVQICIQKADESFNCICFAKLYGSIKEYLDFIKYFYIHFQIIYPEIYLSQPSIQNI